MASYKTSRMLPTILTVIVIIGAIIGLVALARALFFSGSTSNAPATNYVAVARENLLSTTDGSAVSMTVRGPIVADENFRSYQITVSPNERKVQTFKGYLDTTIDQQTLGNNLAAYEQFVFALDKANMATGRQLDEEKNDVRGICATGRVYEFKVIKAGEVTQTLWTSTCSGSNGSLRANVTQLTQLLTSQVPDAQALIRPLSI